MTALGMILYFIFYIFLVIVCLCNWGFLHIGLPLLIILTIVRKIRKKRRLKKLVVDVE